VNHEIDSRVVGHLEVPVFEFDEGPDALRGHDRSIATDHEPGVSGPSNTLQRLPRNPEPRPIQSVATRKHDRRPRAIGMLIPTHRDKTVIAPGDILKR